MTAVEGGRLNERLAAHDTLQFLFDPPHNLLLRALLGLGARQYRRLLRCANRRTNFASLCPCQGNSLTTNPQLGIIRDAYT